MLERGVKPRFSSKSVFFVFVLVVEFSFTSTASAASAAGPLAQHRHEGGLHAVGTDARRGMEREEPRRAIEIERAEEDAQLAERGSERTPRDDRADRERRADGDDRTAWKRTPAGDGRVREREH